MTDYLLDTGDVVAGVEGVLRKVAALLSVRLGEYIETLAAELEIDRGVLRNEITPHLIAPSARKNLSLNDYPAILLVPDNVTSHETIHAEVGHPAISATPVDGVQFRRAYPIRLWAYYHGEADFDETATSRNRLELVVWRCLFDNLQLAYNAKIDPDSYEVNFSTVVADPKSERSIAGFYASMRIETTESLSTPRVSVADTIEVLESRLR